MKGLSHRDFLFVTEAQVPVHRPMQTRPFDTGPARKIRDRANAGREQLDSEFNIHRA